MSSQYEKLVWVKDEQGTVFVCELGDESKYGVHRYEQLSDEEKKHCSSDNEFPFN